MKFAIDEDALRRLNDGVSDKTGIAAAAAWSELAWHLRQRDPPAARAAGQQARALMAAARPDTGDRQRLAARLALVEAELALLEGRGAEAQAQLARAQAGFEEGADLLGQADTQWLRAALAGQRGAVAERQQALQRCAELAGPHDVQRRDIAHAALAEWATSGDVALALQAWQASFPGDVPEDEPGTATWIHNFLAKIAFVQGQFPKAVSHFLRMSEDARHTGQRQPEILALVSIGAAFGNLGDFDAALDWTQQALALAQAQRWTVSESQCQVQLAQLLGVLGRVDAAYDALTQALAAPPDSRSARTHNTLLLYLGETLIERKEFERAYQVFGEMGQRAEALHQPMMRIFADRGQANALAGLGRLDEALQIARDCLARTRDQGIQFEQTLDLELVATLHARRADGDPRHEGVQAAIDTLETLLAVAAGVEGMTVPSKTYELLARQYALVGAYDKAYATTLKATESREKTHNSVVTNRALALQIRYETDRAQADAQHHRELAESQAQQVNAYQAMTATLERLSEIGREITAHLDDQAVFHALDTHVHGLLDATHLSIYLLQADGVHLATAFSREDGHPIPPLLIHLDDPDSHVAECARTRREIHRDRRHEGPNPWQIPGTLVVESLLFAPLTVGDQLLGVMTIQSPRPHAYGERELLVFRTLCSYGAIALNNACAMRQLNATQGQLLQANALLATSNSQLEEMHALRTRLLAAACHDLRQPAHALGMLAELARDEADPVERQQKLDGILRCSATLSDMLSMLMDLTQLEGGRYVPVLEAVELAGVLQEVELQYGNPARRKGLSLQVPATPAHVRSDRQLLRRIVFNLVSNAVKYTPRGSVALVLHQDGQDLQLTVQDTGPGIAPHQLADAFTDYIRLDTSRGSEGLGIGLPIVKRAADLLGHPLRVASEPGQGTAITVALPLCEPPAAAPAAALPETGSATDRPILLVEDDAESLQAMAALLMRRGYPVIAGTGFDEVAARLAARTAPPALLITDMHLRGDNGLAVAARLRRLPGLEELPVLVVTGDLAPGEAGAEMPRGVIVAHKPLTPRRLLQTIEELLARQP